MVGNGNVEVSFNFRVGDKLRTTSIKYYGGMNLCCIGVIYVKTLIQVDYISRQVFFLKNKAHGWLSLSLFMNLELADCTLVCLLLNSFLVLKTHNTSHLSYNNRGTLQYLKGRMETVSSWCNLLLISLIYVTSVMHLEAIQGKIKLRISKFAAFPLTHNL